MMLKAPGNLFALSSLDEVGHLGSTGVIDIGGAIELRCTILIVQICSFLWVDSDKEHKLLISKKSRSDVQHHNHTEILCN